MEPFEKAGERKDRLQNMRESILKALTFYARVLRR